MLTKQNSHTGIFLCVKASSISADSDPAGEPGDRGGRTLPCGPVHHRPQ